ncbi:hypothetical protein [Thiomicrorhabdus lithotrophica]|uniref:Integrase n=1 Tax=Thiomicrorhabdus lithotrophica TaxID=2949997 RepID=A0ABY8CD04_9GAMM|nr:hypothetical protein [Thiomicrorhabdus lithotrophica]WEJ62647.1 hypothetical protein NR989_11660 [Thiomicrorhabdus lithotrophica]
MSDTPHYEFRSGLKRIELETGLPDVIPSAEKIIIQLGGRDGMPFDLGSLCYELREKNFESWSKTGKKVVINSIDASRILFFQTFMEYVFNLKDSPRTKFGYFGALQRFVEFCESSKNISILFKIDRSLEKAQYFLKSIQSYYSKNKNISQVWNFFCYLFEIEGSEANLQLQYWYGHEKQSTPVQPLFDDEVQKVIQFYQALFVVGEDLLIKNSNFPYQWQVPEFLKEKDNQYTLLSNINSTFHKRSDAGKKIISSFSFDTGYWLSSNEIAHKHPELNRRKLNELLKRIERDKELLAEANNDVVHPARIYFAELALHAYRNIFMLLLASNRSGIDGYEDYKDIPWGDFTKETFAKSYWKLYYQKGRANHKKVEFKLLKTDYPLFVRFLNLRKALVAAYGHAEEDCKLLFFSYSKGCFKPFSKTEKFLNVFPEVPKLTAQIARATKSDILLHSTNDIRLVAEILQNTPQTVLRNYAKGTVRGHVQEVGNFLTNISVVVRQTAREPNEIESEVGECDSLNPYAIESTPNHIKPDCSSKEGCLFCDKYRVHADERDVRKLLSYLYFIQDAELLLSQTDQFEAFFKPVVARITEILSYIKEISKEHEEMVIQLEEDVLEDGELSEFFERELELKERVKELWLS